MQFTFLSALLRTDLAQGVKTQTGGLLYDQVENVIKETVGVALTT